MLDDGKAARKALGCRVPLGDISHASCISERHFGRSLGVEGAMP